MINYENLLLKRVILTMKTLIFEEDFGTLYYLLIDLFNEKNNPFGAAIAGKELITKIEELKQIHALEEKGTIKKAK